MLVEVLIDVFVGAGSKVVVGVSVGVWVGSGVEVAEGAIEGARVGEGVGTKVEVLVGKGVLVGTDMFVGVGNGEMGVANGETIAADSSWQPITRNSIKKRSKYFFIISSGEGTWLYSIKWQLDVYFHQSHPPHCNVQKRQS